MVTLATSAAALGCDRWFPGGGEMLREQTLRGRWCVTAWRGGGIDLCALLTSDDLQLMFTERMRRDDRQITCPVPCRGLISDVTGWDAVHTWTGWTPVHLDRCPARDHTETSDPGPVHSQVTRHACVWTVGGNSAINSTFTKIIMFTLTVSLWMWINYTEVILMFFINNVRGQNIRNTRRHQHETGWSTCPWQHQSELNNRIF